jgi:NADH-quinone oxidoreductase subunit N
VMMTLFFGSLAGIPPLVGWLGKFQVFKALASAGGVSSWVLLGIAVVNSVIAGFYYMSVVRRMFFMDPKPEYQLEGAEQQPPAPLQLALGGLTIGVVVFGITSVLPYLSSVATLN